MNALTLNVARRTSSESIHGFQPTTAMFETISWWQVIILGSPNHPRDPASGEPTFFKSETAWFVSVRSAVNAGPLLHRLSER